MYMYALGSWRASLRCSPATTRPGDYLTAPPKCWRWASCIIDSGSTVDSFSDPSVLIDARSSSKTVRVANGNAIKIMLEGMAKLHTYDLSGRPTTISIPGSVSDSRLKSLFSTGKAHRRGMDVHMYADVPHIVLASGRRVPLRRSGDLC